MSLVRSYRIYFRDISGYLSTPREVDIAADEEVREVANRLLMENARYRSAELWDRDRLACIVCRG